MAKTGRHLADPSKITFQSRYAVQGEVRASQRFHHRCESACSRLRVMALPGLLPARLSHMVVVMLDLLRCFSEDYGIPVATYNVGAYILFKHPRTKSLKALASVLVLKSFK